MRNSKALILFALFSATALVLCATAGWSSGIPKFQGYITDGAGLFTPKEKADIERAIKKVTSDFPETRIAVLTLPEIVGDRAVLARQVMSAWKLKDTDVLIMFAVSGKSANLRIDPGVKLIGILTDDRIGQIRKAMEADLSKRRFGEGFLFGINAIHNELKSDRSADRAASGLIIFFILAVVVVAIIVRRRWSRRIAEARSKMAERLSDLLDSLMGINKQVELQISLAKSLPEADREEYKADLALLESDLLASCMKGASSLQRSLGDLDVVEAESRLKKLEEDYKNIYDASEKVSQLFQGKTEDLPKGKAAGDSSVQDPHHGDSESGSVLTRQEPQSGALQEKKWPSHGESGYHSHRVPNRREGDVDVTIINVGSPGAYPGPLPFNEPVRPFSHQPSEPELVDRREGHLHQETPVDLREGPVGPFGGASDQRESESPVIVDPFAPSGDQREGSFSLDGGSARESGPDLTVSDGPPDSVASDNISY